MVLFVALLEEESGKRICMERAGSTHAKVAEDLLESVKATFSNVNSRRRGSRRRILQRNSAFEGAYVAKGRAGAFRVRFCSLNGLVAVAAAPISDSPWEIAAAVARVLESAHDVLDGRMFRHSLRQRRGPELQRASKEVLLTNGNVSRLQAQELEAEMKLRSWNKKKQIFEASMKVEERLAVTSLTEGLRASKYFPNASAKVPGKKKRAELRRLQEQQDRLVQEALVSDELAKLILKPTRDENTESFDPFSNEKQESVPQFNFNPFDIDGTISVIVREQVVIHNGLQKGMQKCMVRGKVYARDSGTFQIMNASASQTNLKLKEGVSKSEEEMSMRVRVSGIPRNQEEHNIGIYWMDPDWRPVQDPVSLRVDALYASREISIHASFVFGHCPLEPRARIHVKFAKPVGGEVQAENYAWTDGNTCLQLDLPAWNHESTIAVNGLHGGNRIESCEIRCKLVCTVRCVAFERIENLERAEISLVSKSQEL